MLIDVRVPQLSESVSEATLLTWHKQVGEAVAEGENLIDIETDKVVLELPASKSGVLTKILKGNGDLVGSEELIALIDTDAVKPVAKAAADVKVMAAVSPSVRKLAHEHDVDALALHLDPRRAILEIEEALRRIKQELGLAVLLVEQYLDFAERLADRYVIMAKGAVVASGATRDLRPEMVRQHLAV